MPPDRLRLRLVAIQHLPSLVATTACQGGKPFPGERLGLASPGCPVDQLDGVDHRDSRACCNLCDAADVAGWDHIRLDLFDIRDFAFAQPPRKLRLKDIVGASRATAQMSLRYIFNDESKVGK